MQVSLQLALANLTQRPGQTAVRIVGIAFPVLLVFMQLGALGAVLNTATLVFDELDFDAALVSSDYHHILRASTFPRTLLNTAAGVDGVVEAAPLYAGGGLWLAESGDRRKLLLIGVDARQVPFSNEEVRAHVPLLRGKDTLIFDRQTQPEFGDVSPGKVSELDNRRMEVVGQFTIGTGFAANGFAIVDHQAFSRISGRPVDRLSFGLLKLSAEANTQTVIERLRATLPPGVNVLTRSEVLANERSYWNTTTSIGLIVRSIAGVAFGVGVIILYQILSTDIANRIGEYATMKAMGFARKDIRQVVLAQAVILSLCGFLPGFLLSIPLYRMTASAANLPMSMPVSRVVGVFFLIGIMAVGAGLLSLRRLSAADPAELF